MANHRSLAEWQLAMDLAAQVYRLAEDLRVTGAAQLASRLLDGAAGAPVAIAQGVARLDTGEDALEPLGRAERSLLQTETCLLLAARLRYLPDAQVAGPLAIIDDLRERLAAVRPAPAPPTPVPPPAPAPAPQPEPSAVETPKPVSKGAPAPEAAGAPVNRLVLDGCNFLGRAPGYRLGDPEARDRFLMRLQEYAKRHPAHRITVFFDGRHASRRTTGHVEERVTSGQRSGDDIIIEFLQSLPEAERSRSSLVTDDRDLGVRARKLGVKTETVAAVAGRLERKPEPPGHRPQTVGRGDLSEWEDFFSQPPQRPGKGPK